MRIITLAENTVRTRSLLAEHGLSFAIEDGSQLILFDTGQGHVLLHNARELGVRLDALSAVVISHGHYDHTGALDAVLDAARRAVVYLHPAAEEKKYGRRGDTVADVGMPSAAARALRSRGTPVVRTASPAEVAPGIHVTGAIPRHTTFEDTGGSFYLDEACSRPDPLIDDQALYIESARGLVVILGCAHAGVVNTLDHVARLTGRSHIHAVLGGMHLARASGHRLDKTAETLETYNVDWIAPAHCTGRRATAYLHTRFASRFAECSVGSIFEFA